jgi:hypothetical protein
VTLARLRINDGIELNRCESASLAQLTMSVVSARPTPAHPCLLGDHQAAAQAG